MYCIIYALAYFKLDSERSVMYACESTVYAVDTMACPMLPFAKAVTGYIPLMKLNPDE